MSRIRRGPQRADRFTIIPNSWARDVTLTWGARGLLLWLHSHAAGFEVDETAIIEASQGPQCGRDGVRKLIRELVAHGYLKRERKALPAGGVSVDYALQDPTEIPSHASEATDGNSVQSPEQGKQDIRQDVPAGQAKDQATDGNSVGSFYREDQEKTNTKTSSSLRAARSTTTATRIPEGFVPTEEMRRWFADEKLAAVIDGKAEHEKFVDYWLGAPGLKGRKLDWPATWRNWMRTAAERAPRRVGTAVTQYGGVFTAKPSTTDQRVAQTLAMGAMFEEEDAR